MRDLWVANRKLELFSKAPYYVEEVCRLEGGAWASECGFAGEAAVGATNQEGNKCQKKRRQSTKPSL